MCASLIHAHATVAHRRTHGSPIPCSFSFLYVSIPSGMFFFSTSSLVTSLSLLVFLSYQRRRQTDRQKKKPELNPHTHSTIAEQHNLRKAGFTANPFELHVTSCDWVCVCVLRTLKLQPCVKWNEFIDKGGTSKSQQHYVSVSRNFVLTMTAAAAPVSSVTLQVCSVLYTRTRFISILLHFLSTWPTIKKTATFFSLNLNSILAVKNVHSEYGGDQNSWKRQ